MPAASARTSPSASAWLSPKMTVLTASFMAAPLPSGPRWKTRRPDGVEDGPGPLEVGGLAADHEGQLAALGQA